MSIFDQLVGLLAPHTCLGCGAEGASLCTTCRDALPAVPPRCFRCMTPTNDSRTCPACRKVSDLYAVWPATTYEALAKQTVHVLKFERAQAAARDIAYSIAARMSPPNEVLVTFAPTAPARMRQRGYDQARLIAQSVARQLGCPFIPLLARQTTERQVGQQRAVRLQQMHDAFRPINTSAIGYHHIVVIDDVITTGATLSAAAHALHAVGAKRVSAAVFAAA